MTWRAQLGQARIGSANFRDDSERWRNYGNAGDLHLYRLILTRPAEVDCVTR